MLKDEQALPEQYICQTQLHFLEEYEEAHDILIGVSKAEGYCIANFRFGAIALPPELSNRLKGLIGKKCAVLHLSGYHVREY